MKRLGVFLLPLDGMLVHCSVTPSIKFAATSAFNRDTWGGYVGSGLRPPPLGTKLEHLSWCRSGGERRLFRLLAQWSNLTFRGFYEYDGNFSRSPRPSSCCMLWGHHRQGWVSVAVGFKHVEKSWLSLWRLWPIWPGRDGRFRVFSRV